MKKKLGAEIETNKEKFLKYWKELRDRIKDSKVNYFNDSSIEELMAVFLNIKPSVGLEFDEDTDLEALMVRHRDLLEKFGYDSVVNDEGDMMTLYDKEKVKEILTDNSDIFTDYDEKKDNCEEVLQKIIDAEMGQDDYYKKMGIIFGYPRQDCEDFVRMMNEGKLGDAYRIKAPGIVYRSKDRMSNDDYEILKKHKRTFQLAGIDKLTI